MPDMKITIEDVVANDNTCVVRWTARGTNDGELMGAPPTGRHVDITGISIDRYNADGKLVEIWDQWDNFGFMGQLGLVPEAAAAS
jgi:predicted ester cyclase